MLEWYEVGKTYLDLIESVKKYISNFMKIKFSTLTLPKDLPGNEPDFNQNFLNEIEPGLPHRGGVFITGYPAFLSPLAKTGQVDNFSGALNVLTHTQRKKNLSAKPLSDRFELYINGVEIANGCTENRDSGQIKLAFEAEDNYRLTHHLPSHPISRDFIKNCSLIPPSAGVGLGLERLLDIIKNVDR
jgi:elongation factor P--beta-lysine ligase